jgi:hypothetical protein
MPYFYQAIMKLPYLFLMCALCQAEQAQAEIYKRVDAEGRVTYSSTPLKGATRLYLAPLAERVSPEQIAAPAVNSSVSQPMRARRNEEVANFPRVDSLTQRGRDNTRRRILEDELSAEQKALADMQKKISDSLNNPEMDRSPDGKISRNIARQEEKLAALRAQLRTHEKNISALKTELANQR